MMTYIRRGSSTAGPFTITDLKFQIRATKLTPDCPARSSDMNTWSTMGELHPTLFSAQALASLKQGKYPTSNLVIGEPVDPEAREKLKAFYAPLLKQMENRWGAVARPTHGFYAHRALTVMIQRVRLDLMEGGKINRKGLLYVTRVAAFLASIVIDNWERRGFTTKGFVCFSDKLAENKIRFWTEREREGQTETYGHDFFKDTVQALLQPRQMFPYMHDRFYAMESLTLPSPEYLYLFGTFFMSSPLSFGNWPRGKSVGCLLSDFEQSRNILVDDLHQDCGLPKDHEGYRKLSWWFVFPPYGWDMNDGGDYNMMTFFSQVVEHEIVSRDEAISYLRALLGCQGIEIQNLAARCLMVLRTPPQDALESLHYEQALNFRDHPYAAAAMDKYQHQIEAVDLNDAFREQVTRERLGWLDETPPMLSHRTVAESDPDYIDMEKNPPSIEEGINRLEALINKHPEDWVLKVLYASQLLKGPDLAKGEEMMKSLVAKPADCFEGHSRYGTWLKYAEGRRPEAFVVYEDSLKRWPWCQQACDACVWMLTDGMVDMR